MKTIIIDVASSGTKIELALKPGVSSGQVVLVLSDEVEIGAPTGVQHGSADSAYREYASDTGFPPRKLTEQAIVQIIKEHSGSVRITDKETGWNIYDEIAARLGVSMDARRRLTAGSGESAWRPEVGFARKNLEQRGIVSPTDVSGRGVWQLGALSR
jgi:hypothetical protein